MSMPRLPAGAQRPPADIERRRGAVLELRTVSAGGGAAGRRLEGYAATFGTPALIGGRYTETIRAGAFRASLATPGRDVLALVDHDSGRLLARTSSGTLRLTEDARGLGFSIDVPDTQLGRDLLAMVERGDVGGMSFGFRAASEAWPNERTRELLAVELVEISVVQAFPAYDSTTIAARAAGQHDAARLRAMRLAVL